MQRRVLLWGPVFLVVFLAVLGVARAGNARGQDRSGKDTDLRLVLLITVDQFRYDYLPRFADQYSGGLARLLREGAVFTNAHLEHYPTVTAPGHTALGSGAMPSTSGIIGNDWFDRDAGKNVSSVSDEQVTQIGGTAAASASPHRLQVTTVSDELKLAARARGAADLPRAVGVSLKDRSAILPVGRSADAAFWYDIGTGEFVTSTYYADALPDWVQQFNGHRLRDTYAGKPWAFLAAPDTQRVTPPSPGRELYAAIYGSPFGNELLTRFAIAALDGERLGQREAVDVFSVSYSSNDSVGHTYGPDAPEVRAISLQTDQTIGELLTAVDRRVGLHRVLVVFTSDHGVAPLPEVLAKWRLPGGRIAQEDLFGPIRTRLQARFGAGQWISGTAGTSPYLNHALMSERGVDQVEARQVAAAAARSLPHVTRVYTREQLLNGMVPDDAISRRIVQSYHLQRSGDLEIVLNPFWIRQKSGTTHGTPYAYDAHIPLIFLGNAVAPGRYARSVALNDVAPTLATRLGVSWPSGSHGRVLTEVLITRTDAASR
jgi:predicted AlkP superfamily pyrophosphatase or phosphodiesterase